MPPTIGSIKQSNTLKNSGSISRELLVVARAGWRYRTKCTKYPLILTRYQIDSTHILFLTSVNNSLQDKNLSHHNNGYIIGKRIFGVIILCVDYRDTYKKGEYYFLWWSMCICVVLVVSLFWVFTLCLGWLVKYQLPHLIKTFPHWTHPDIRVGMKIFNRLKTN